MLPLSALETNLVKPRVIPLDFAMGAEGRGSVITADLDGDGRLDFVVTPPGHLATCRDDGQPLWHRETDLRVSAGSSEKAGLPGHDAPGVQVADVDGHGRAESFHLDQMRRVVGSVQEQQPVLLEVLWPPGQARTTSIPAGVCEE